MKKAKALFIMLFIVIATTTSKAQSNIKISTNDLKNLVGSWQGSLTYLDYQSGKPYTMPANLKVERIGKSSDYKLYNIYPNEKSANSTDTLKITSNGKFIGTEQIKSKQKLKNGNLEIVTEKSGTDGNDNKPAIFRYTYTISKSAYKKRKDVQYLGESNWIKRHEYSYQKEEQ